MTGADDPDRDADHDPSRARPTEPFASPSGPTAFPGGAGAGEPPAWGQATPPAGPADPYAPPAPYGAPQHGDQQYGAPQYGAPQYGAPQYGAPQYGGQQYGAPQYPAYGGPGTFAQNHGGATTSLVLGIIGCVAAVLCFCTYGVAAIGTLVSPFAIWLGLKARREMDANPGAYSNRGVAQGGFVTGIVGTVLGFLELVAVAVGVVILVTSDNSYYY